MVGVASGNQEYQCSTDDMKDQSVGTRSVLLPPSCFPYREGVEEKIFSPFVRNGLRSDPTWTDKECQVHHSVRVEIDFLRTPFLPTHSLLLFGCRRRDDFFILLPQEYSRNAHTTVNITLVSLLPYSKDKNCPLVMCLNGVDFYTVFGQSLQHCLGPEEARTEVYRSVELLLLLGCPRPVQWSVKDWRFILPFLVRSGPLGWGLRTSSRS